MERVAGIITGYWPHRMSHNAAQSIDQFYKDQVLSIWRDAKGLNLARLRVVSALRNKRWVGTADWSLADHSNELGGETGEAMNIVKKIRRLQTGVAGRNSEADLETLIGKLADELADVVICADKLAAQVGIDLSVAVVAKFNAKSDEMGFPEHL